MVLFTWYTPFASTRHRRPATVSDDGARAKNESATAAHLRCNSR